MRLINRSGKKLSRNWRRVIMSVPLAAAVGASLLPLQLWGRQVLVLLVLLWLQIFFLSGWFLPGK